MSEWVKIRSDELKMDVAYNTKTRELLCADKTRYSHDELCIVHEKHEYLPKIVHDIKRAFGGTIVG